MNQNAIDQTALNYNNQRLVLILDSCLEEIEKLRSYSYSACNLSAKADRLFAISCELEEFLT